MNYPDAAAEIELKLLVPPRAVRRLAAHRLLRGQERPAKHRLYSIYFDTPAHDLRRQGIALRLRREGRRWVQTVKGGGTAQGGLHQRAEVEMEVGGPALDLSQIANAGLAEAFSSASLHGKLKPVLITDFTRSVRVLTPDPGTRIEACIDRGVIRSGKRFEPLAEVELELKSGSPQQLYSLALNLAKDLPLSLENRSKAERGYALARGKANRPVKARPAALSNAMTVNDAFRAVLETNLAHLLANERGMLAGADLEFLHQMRVAVRRLRSALGVFTPPVPELAVARFAGELKWLAGKLGPARDWDVFTSETLPPIASEFGAHGELKAFGVRCEQLRRAANARARRAVRSARYRRLVLSLAAWIAGQGWRDRIEPRGHDALGVPAREFAIAVLDRRYRQARNKGRKFGKLSPAGLHRLRIAIKKFRYAADFFAALYEAKAVRAALKRLSRLQDILGAMNDAATVENLMVHGFDGTAGPRVLETRGILLGWNRGRAETLKRELKGAWKAFRASRRFWRQA